MFRKALLITLLCLVWAERKDYEGFHVWRIIPNNNEALLTLTELSDNLQVQFWDEHFQLGRAVEMLVPPTLVESLYHILPLEGVSIDVLNTNLQQSLKGNWARINSRNRAYDKDDFNTYEDIIREVDRLALEECPEGFDCETYTIGQSVEGRDIRMLKITKGSRRQAVWIDSLIHAREWLAGATNMRILDKLMTEYGIDDDATYLLDNYDWYFTPVQNPDGYSYTMSPTGDRFWRKNRSANSGGTCRGVDLNRNFDSFWGGDSQVECSDSYQGPSAASEPEIQAVQAEVLKVLSEQTIIAVWSIHAAIPALLMPWSATVNGQCQRPDDYEEVLQVADATADAIEDTFGTTWDRGSPCEILYQATGTTMDFAKEHGIKYPYGPEVRGPGFDPPASAIKPSSEECWNGVVAMMREIEIIDKDNSMEM